MFEQDFIMRQVRMFTQVLKQVLFKKQEGKHQEARQLAKQSLEKLAGDNPKKFHELSLKETLEVFQKEGQFQSELAFIVADLLIEEGELLNSDESEKCYLQALLLYQKALKDPEAAMPLQAVEKVNQLKDKLSESSKLDEASELLK